MESPPARLVARLRPGKRAVVLLSVSFLLALGFTSAALVKSVKPAKADTVSMSTSTDYLSCGGWTDWSGTTSPEATNNSHSCSNGYANRIGLYGSSANPVDASSGDAKAFYQFPTLSTNVPAGATITSASLSIPGTVADVSGNSAETLNLHAADTAWSSSTMSYYYDDGSTITPDWYDNHSTTLLDSESVTVCSSCSTTVTFSGQALVDELTGEMNGSGVATGVVVGWGGGFFDQRWGSTVSTYQQQFTPTAYPTLTVTYTTAFTAPSSSAPAPAGQVSSSFTDTSGTGNQCVTTGTNDHDCITDGEVYHTYSTDNGATWTRSDLGYTGYNAAACSLGTGNMWWASASTTGTGSTTVTVRYMRSGAVQPTSWTFNISSGVAKLALTCYTGSPSGMGAPSNDSVGVYTLDATYGEIYNAEWIDTGSGTPTYQVTNELIDNQVQDSLCSDGKYAYMVQHTSGYEYITPLVGENYYAYVQVAKATGTISTTQLNCAFGNSGQADNLSLTQVNSDGSSYTATFDTGTDVVTEPNGEYNDQVTADGAFTLDPTGDGSTDGSPQWIDLASGSTHDYCKVVVYKPWGTVDSKVTVDCYQSDKTTRLNFPLIAAKITIAGPSGEDASNQGQVVDDSHLEVDVHNSNCFDGGNYHAKAWVWLTPPAGYSGAANGKPFSVYHGFTASGC